VVAVAAEGGRRPQAGRQLGAGGSRGAHDACPSLLPMPIEGREYPRPQPAGPMSAMVAIAIGCILVLLAVFIILIIFLGQSVSDGKLGLTHLSNLMNHSNI